jgi:hypothetical protein
MSKLFSNGCSFLTPRPADKINTFVTKILAEQYNLQLFNLAMGGRGNDRISFTTKLWFEQHGATDTFAVIGWSSLFRNDYVTNDGHKKGRIPNMQLTWRTWKVADQLRFVNSNDGWDIDDNATMKFLDHVFDLQTYFKLNKIPYVMYNALPNHIDLNNSDFSKIVKSLDEKRFFKLNSSHYDYTVENKQECKPGDQHPSKKGHKDWAYQLKEFIDANNLRTI